MKKGEKDVQNFKDLWSMVIENCKKYVSVVSFNTWIKPIRPVKLTADEIILSVAGSLNKNMVMTKL